MTNFSVTFDLNFNPQIWTPELESEFEIKLNKNSDLRSSFSFLYASEKVLFDIQAKRIPSWELDNVTINKKNYSASIIKDDNSSDLKLLINCNQINLLEQKIAKQNIQLSDPFHWTKNLNDKGNFDLDYLNTIYEALKASVKNIESEFLDKPIHKNAELKRLDHEVKVLKDLVLMTKNYLNQRTK